MVLFQAARTLGKDLLQVLVRAPTMTRLRIVENAKKVGE